MKEFNVTIILKGGKQITDELILTAAEIAEQSGADDTLILYDGKSAVVAHEVRVNI